MLVTRELSHLEKFTLNLKPAWSGLVMFFKSTAIWMYPSSVIRIFCGSTKSVAMALYQGDKRWDWIPGYD